MSVLNAGFTGNASRKDGIFPAGQITLFILITVLFFLWAIPNNLNDVLIRQFMKSFAISRFQAGLVQSAFYMGYFLLAMPAALLMRRFGYKFWLHHRFASLRHGNDSFLAGGDHRAVLVFS